MLAMKEKCATCQNDIALYKKYLNWKLNKESFEICIRCYKMTKSKTNEKIDSPEAMVVTSSIATTRGQCF